jgi:hypothetical protein
MRRRPSAMPFPFGVPLVSLAFRISACLVVLVVAGCGRLAGHPLVKEATAEVRANARVAAVLGTPVECGTAIRGTANETDGIATLQFDVKGPKAAGVVVVEGKKTKNEWGVTLLELRPSGADKLSLTADLEARTGTDTPKFDPTAKPGTTSSAPPPGDIEIALPPGVPGQP